MDKPKPKSAYYGAVAICQIGMFLVWALLSYGAYWIFDGGPWFWFVTIFFALDIAYEMWTKPIK